MSNPVPRPAEQHDEVEAFVKQMEQVYVGASKMGALANRNHVSVNMRLAWAIERMMITQERQTHLLEMLCRIIATAGGVRGPEKKIVVP